MCYESIVELQKRADLSVPLLKFLKSTKNMFKVPIKKFKEELNNLANNQSYEEFQGLIDEIKLHSKGKLEFKYDFITKMIELIKESCIYQNELNKILKPFYSMSSLIKMNKRPVFNSNLSNIDQAKAVKFINIFARADFLNKELTNIDNAEILFVINLLESQQTLIQEYKKTIISGVEEYRKINLNELEIFLTKYKNVQKEIKIFQEMAFSNFDKINFNKETINQILKDIKRVVDKYKEYQAGIFKYQELLTFFQRIRNMVAQTCSQEFNQDVELICEFNLQ